MACVTRGRWRRAAALRAALAVFLLSLVGLGQLVTGASNIGHEAQQRSQAGLLAQSKMAEVAAGAVPLNSQSQVAFEEDPNAHWSLEVQQGWPAANLFTVTVQVTTKRPGGGQSEVTLSRMMLDPAQAGSTQDTVTVQNSGTVSTGTQTSGNASSGSPGSC